MSKSFLVPTGSIIREYLIEYGFTQKEACQRLGISEKHFSNVINGNSRLTEEFALKLENLLPVPASYWLNIEIKYREYLARVNQEAELTKLDLKSIAKRFRFSEVFHGLDWSIERQANEMLKLLKINSFESFEKVYDVIPARFMEDGGQKEAIAIWLNMCEKEIDLQNNIPEGTKFSICKLKKDLEEFKCLALNDNVSRAFLNCRKLCNKNGINLVVVEALSGCKVRGVITMKKGVPTIYLSGRFKTHDHIWFAFMHEIGHLLKHFNSQDMIISDDKFDLSIENEANVFARDFFVNRSSYEKFIQKKQFSVSDIVSFAKTQDVLPGIIVAFLQHDKQISNSAFANLKIRFDINDVKLELGW